MILRQVEPIALIGLPVEVREGLDGDEGSWSLGPDLAESSGKFEVSRTLGGSRQSLRRDRALCLSLALN
jgi:hypothetical protein